LSNAFESALVLKADTGRQRRKEGGTAARYQADHEIVRCQPGNRVEHAPAGFDAGRVRYGMARFQYRDGVARNGMAVPGHHHAG
jgi:hypothetical protein